MNTRLRGASDHVRHDRLLVSRLASEDAYPGEVAEARRLIERCSECAHLATEVAVLRSALADLPTPRRTHDYRLTPEKANLLRGGALERALRRLAGPGLAPLRPLAGVAMSFGLVLAVVGAALPAPAADTLMLSEGEPRAAMPDDRGAPEATFAAPADNGNAGAQEGTDPQRETLGLQDSDGAQAADPSRFLLMASGLAIALLSLAVLLVVVFARRRMSDPLLR